MTGEPGNESGDRVDKYSRNANGQKANQRGWVFDIAGTEDDIDKTGGNRRNTKTCPKDQGPDLFCTYFFSDRN